MSADTRGVFDFYVIALYSARVDLRVESGTRRFAFTVRVDIDIVLPPFRMGVGCDRIVKCSDTPTGNENSPCGVAEQFGHGSEGKIRCGAN